MSKLGRVRRALKGDGGFTLIEALVALVLVALLFIGLAGSMAVSLRNARENRTQQQATGLALEGIEFARSLSWASLAMIPADYTSDPRIGGSSFVGSSIGVSSNDPIVESGSGLIPVYTSQTLDGETFSISQYVTRVSSTLRRVIVVVEWGGGPGSRDYYQFTEIAQSEAS